jgi:hypothetical protein
VNIPRSSGMGSGAISITPAMSVYTKIMESGPSGAASASGVLLLSSGVRRVGPDSRRCPRLVDHVSEPGRADGCLTAQVRV